MKLFNKELNEIVEVTWEEEGGEYEMEGAIKKYGLHVVGTRDYSYGYLLKDGNMIDWFGKPLVVVDSSRNFPSYKHDENFIGTKSEEKVEIKKERSFWDSP